MQLKVTISMPEGFLGGVVKSTYSPGVTQIVSPVVQFNGKWFENGQTHFFEIYEQYEIGPEPDMDPLTAVAIDFELNETVEVHQVKRIHRFDGCMHCPHIEPENRCCHHMQALSVFTLHELGFKTEPFGSMKTKDGVTISWEMVPSKNKEDNDAEENYWDCRTFHPVCT